jgi:isocitrate lyase
MAADANLAGQMYPDQSLYPANSVPAVVKRILAISGGQSSTTALHGSTEDEQFDQNDDQASTLRGDGR